MRSDVLAAAAAAVDAGQHLSVCPPVASAHCRIDDPRKSEVGGTDRPAGHLHEINNDHIVTSHSQNATQSVRKPQDDEGAHNRSCKVDAE